MTAPAMAPRIVYSTRSDRFSRQISLSCASSSFHISLCSNGSTPLTSQHKDLIS